MYYNTELYHHGILGQKWGVRRYQNDDGTLTEAGKKRYNNQSSLNKNQQTAKARQVKNTAKTVAKGAAKAVALSAVMALALSELSTEDNQPVISTGKSTVNSYMKQNSKKKISTFKNEEKGWADYAWEEIQKSGWG